MTQPRSLTDRQRDVLLNELKETAPDVIIVSAVRQSRFYHEHVKELEQVPYGRELYKVPSRAETTPEPGLGQKVDFVNVTASEPVRANVDPGKPSIGKIGSTTKEELLRTLQQEKIPHAKYSEHLKLLWSRGEIKFDGERYYV